MIQLIREEKRALYCITCSQQVPNQHATTTKQNREELFFRCKSEDLCCSHICWVRGGVGVVKIASFKICVRQLFTLNLQYLGKLPPSTGVQGHNISFPLPIKVAAACEEPYLSALACFLRSDSLESEETPTKSIDTGLFPSSFQLLLFQLSVTSALQTA